MPSHNLRLPLKHNFRHSLQMLLTDKGGCPLLALVRTKSLGYQTPRYLLGLMRHSRRVPKCTIDLKDRGTALTTRMKGPRDLTKARKPGMLLRWR